MATWRQVSGRVRRVVSRLSIGERRGCCQGCWGNERAREAAAESRAWLREMKQPLPAGAPCTHPSLHQFFRQGCYPLSLSTISSKPGDRDVVRGDLAAADKVNDRRRPNRDPEPINERVI